MYYTRPSEYNSPWPYDIHQQVFHGVDEADVQIAAQAQILAVDDHIVDLLTAYSHLLVRVGSRLAE
jgi:hypothetical protein